jgi:Zn-dependent M28 family amino/carboxypeptidase
MYKLSPDIFRSDHANFWEASIPAVMWTDTSNFRNPNYHKASDTPDTLDYDFMGQVALMLAHLVDVGK